MRFGLFGGARTERGDQVIDSRIYSDYVNYICEAEALGFHSVFLVEHHFTGFGQISATLNFLTYLAAKTTTIRLGTAVLVLPWHNPALLAEQAATLDLLSGGRFDFGIGKVYRRGIEAQGRVYDPSTVGLTRALHIAMNEAERAAAHELRAKFMRNVQQLSLSPTGESPTLGRPRRFLTREEMHEATERDTLIGPPQEIVARLKQLQ